MKPTISTLLTALLLNISCLSHGGESAALDLKDSSVARTLKLYAEASDLQLVVASNVKNLNTPITIAPMQGVAKPEAVSLIETALLEQAGVVITRLGDRRASVTYNDALCLPVLAQSSALATNWQHEIKSLGTFGYTVDRTLPGRSGNDGFTWAEGDVQDGVQLFKNPETSGLQSAVLPKPGGMTKPLSPELMGTWQTRELEMLQAR